MGMPGTSPANVSSADHMILLPFTHMCLISPPTPNPTDPGTWAAVEGALSPWLARGAAGTDGGAMPPQEYIAASGIDGFALLIFHTCSVDIEK